MRKYRKMMYQNYVFDFYGTLADIRTDEENPGLWEKMSEIYRALGADYGPQELQYAFRRLENEEKKRLGHEELKRPGQEELKGPGQEELKRPGQEKLKRPGQEELKGPGQEELKGPGHGDRDQSEAENAEPDLTKVFVRLYHEKNAVCDASQARMTAITFRALSRQFLRAYDGVEELLGELRKRGRKIFLLSNAQTDFTRPEIEMLGLTSYFDGIVLSSEQGCKKPSPVFFRRLLEQFCLNPAESIMIGNDEAADIAGAQSVGMDTLYIHTDISPEEYGNVRATYRVMDGDFRKIGRMLLED